MKSTLNFHWKDWYWSCSSNTLATWCKELTHCKRLWCWQRLRAGGEVGDRGWDGWMASPTQWTWVWANSRRYWRTGKPGVRQSMGSQLDMTERLNNKLCCSQCLGTQHSVECFSGQLPFAYRWRTPLYTFPILVPFPIGPEQDVSPFYRQGNCGSSKVPKLTHANSDGARLRPHALLHTLVPP